MSMAQLKNLALGVGLSAVLGTFACAQGAAAPAGAEDARYIVTGRRGAGGRTQRLLGSTSAQLADHAEVPVVIVP